MKGDTLAAGGHSASWGPLKVSQQKWDSIFGKLKKEKKRANRDNAKKGQ